MWEAVSCLALVLVLIPTAYLYVLLLGAVRSPKELAGSSAEHRFAVAIPAHDEEAVIGRTVRSLRVLDYPPGGFDVYVAADHCTDQTALAARASGAACFERSDGALGGKAAALNWLLERIRETGRPYDAVVVLDADTQVETGFLRAMSARLAQGDRVIQGQHRIQNPGDGWYPALSDALFRVTNRVFNQGRANLGLSAMNMGDSICLRSDVLERSGDAQGLTEDYDLRLRLLADGIRIAYEPAAIGSGEAPSTWAAAARQRQRWLAGTFGTTRRSLGRLLRAAASSRRPVLLDAVAQMIFPSFSTLTVASGVVWLAQACAFAMGSPDRVRAPLVGWTAVLGSLLLLPLLGLALDRAPLRSFVAVFSGPAFVLWRTWLAVRSRFVRPPTNWVRTPRRTLEDR